MATTTTTTTTQTLSVLADYEVHHSGADHESEHEPVTSPQPVEWPTHHRRMPEFRPTNRNLSFEERPGGSNPAEMVFIQVMLHGVWLNAVSVSIRHDGVVDLLTLYRQCPGFGGLLAEESMIRSFIMRLEENGRFDIGAGGYSVLLFISILSAQLNLHILSYLSTLAVHDNMKCFHNISKEYETIGSTGNCLIWHVGQKCVELRKIRVNAIQRDGNPWLSISVLMALAIFFSSKAEHLHSLGDP
jgi:hypothetical protein